MEETVQGSYPSTGDLTASTPSLQGSVQDLNGDDKKRTEDHGAAKKKRASTKETFSVTRTEDDEDHDKVNQYMVLDSLGNGQYGVVKLVENTEDGKQYAMKIVSRKRLKRKMNIGQPQSNPLLQVNREIAILKKLDHKNVVCLYEVMDDNSQDNIYMVFELVDGGPVMKINEYTTVEPFSEDKARKYFVDLLLGVEYLHFQKIIHRDIKPENLLLTRDGILKITDFGVSHVFLDNDDQLKASAGSPAFLPPEAISTTGKEYRGRAVDVWAMGITLFCFAFGRVPFLSKNILDLYEMIRSEDVKFPDDVDVSEDLKHLIFKMLTKDPTARIEIKEIREHPWVTKKGTTPLISVKDNCQTEIEVTEEEVRNAVTAIISLSTLVRIKAMGRRRSFSTGKVKNSNPNLSLKSNFATPPISDVESEAEESLTQSVSNLRM
eukprot:Colp12_sorted_trinity150504_noHs@5988